MEALGEARSNGETEGLRDRIAATVCAAMSIGYTAGGGAKQDVWPLLDDLARKPYLAAADRILALLGAGEGAGGEANPNCTRIGGCLLRFSDSCCCQTGTCEGAAPAPAIERLAEREVLWISDECDGRDHDECSTYHCDCECHTRAALAPAVQPARGRDAACWVCGAGLTPETDPPHCEDCEVDDDTRAEWEAAVQPESEAREERYDCGCVVRRVRCETHRRLEYDADEAVPAVQPARPDSRGQTSAAAQREEEANGE